MARNQGSGKKPVDKQKQADKRARRDERKAAEAAARASAARKKKIRTGLFVALGVVVLGTTGFLIFQKANPGELPGVTQEANNGRGHVPNGETVPYPSAAPTSGTHSSGVANRCGVFTQPLPLEPSVHALEHGTVVIWYQSDLETAIVSELASIVRQFDEGVILSPNPGLTDAVVTTAWTRSKAYSDADPEIAEFIETYRDRGPESVSCNY